MSTHLYLSLIPESLIASELPPEEFGSYYAVGTKKRSRGQAVFFEVEPFESDYFPWEVIQSHCVPHADGRPKRSVYLSIYRALEHVPVAKLKKLYLVTEDGRVLGLDSAPYVPDQQTRFHLYQEFCPVTPRVVSRLNPAEFVKSITDRSQSVSVDRIVFCELKLDGLAQDPEAQVDEDIPYPNLGHLRDCLRELLIKPSKANKSVNRAMTEELLFRTIRSGFFVGDQQEMKYFPMPPKSKLEREYFEWWRSALNTFGG